MSVVLILLAASVSALRPERPLLVSSQNTLNGSVWRTTLVDAASGRHVDVPYFYCSWSSDGAREMVCSSSQSVEKRDPAGVYFGVDGGFYSFDPTSWEVKAIKGCDRTTETWDASAHVAVSSVDYGVIRVTALDGRFSPRKISLGFREIASMRLSPDGKWIALSLGTNRPKQDKDRSPDTWILRIDGTGRRRIGRGGTPRWSPDGRKLLVVGGSGVRTWISELDVASGDSRVLAAPGDGYEGAAYSPDGTRVAVSSDSRLYLANRDGKVLRVLSTELRGALDW